MELRFVVPNDDCAVYAEAVLETLDALGYSFEYDETSPPDEVGDVTYKVIGVQKGKRKKGKTNP